MREAEEWKITKRSSTFSRVLWWIIAVGAASRAAGFLFDESFTLSRLSHVVTNVLLLSVAVPFAMRWIRWVK